MQETLEETGRGRKNNYLFGLFRVILFMIGPSVNQSARHPVEETKVMSRIL